MSSIRKNKPLSTFFSQKCTIVDLFLILELFKLIKGPLSGLYYNTDKCKPEDSQGVLLVSALLLNLETNILIIKCILLLNGSFFKWHLKNGQIVSENIEKTG